jgi:excisionase family DNA binding protein
MANAEEPALWSVREVAHFLKRSERWVRSRISIDPKVKGSMPFYRLGRGLRFSEEEIRRWLDGGCPPSSEIRVPRGGPRRG